MLELEYRERRRVFEFVDGVVCDDVSERMRVFCLLFIKGKKKSEAQVLKFPAGEFVTLWAHPHTCTQYPYKIQLENAMQPFYLYLVQYTIVKYHKFRLKDCINNLFEIFEKNEKLKK